MVNEEKDASNIVARRGIYFQAFDIYGQVAGFYDYGPIGLRIKRNFEALWRKSLGDMLDAYEVETTNIMPEPVFKASGHLTSFTDPVVACTSCKSSHRADKLLEEAYAKKGDTAAAGRVEKMSNAELEKELRANGIKCPKCGKASWSKVETFNLLFKTSAGASDAATTMYLRPETPQGIFIDFKNLYRWYSMKLPVAITQTGKAYRNEISPRQQLVRLRELSQMDVELFFDPDDKEGFPGSVDEKEALDTRIPILRKGKEREETVTIASLLNDGTIPNKQFALMLALEQRFVDAVGFPEGKYRYRHVEVTPHYSKCNFDLEVKTSYGYIELSGLAYRTDYDLSSHAKVSGQDLSVLNGEKKVVAHVVELSIGMDRPLFAILDTAFEQGADRGWPWLRLADGLVPYRYGIFPLQKDEKLIEKARKIQKKLAEMKVSAFYSETASIGKRYARADEIGVPYCITVDFQTLEDDTFTVRDRDTAKQVRKKIAELD